MPIKRTLASVSNFVLNFFAIKPQEFGQANLFLFYLITVSIFAMSVLTIGEALFLSHYTTDQLEHLLPWIYICVAIGSILITSFYNNFLENLSRIKLIILMDLLFCASLILFQYLITIEAIQSWIYFVLYVWLDAAAAFKILLFYSYTGDFFTSYEAKRLYGYITNGLPLGAIIGGLILTVFLQYVRVIHALYFCAGVCALSAFAAYLIKQKVSVKTLNLEVTDSSESVTLKSIFTNPYLNLIFLIVAFSAMSWAFSDYVLLRTARTNFTVPHELAEFFTKFFSMMGFIQLTIQMVFARRILRRFGVVRTLFILPSSLIITSLLFYYESSLMFAALIGWAYLGFAETIDIYCQEILYLPLPAFLRLRSQSIANGLLTASGKISAGLILLGLSMTGIALNTFGLTIVVVGILWIIALALLNKYYKKTFAIALGNYFTGRMSYYAKEFNRIRDGLKDPQLNAEIIELLEHSTDSHKLAILNFLPNENIIRLKDYLYQLLHSKHTPLVLAVINRLGNIGDTKDAEVLAPYIHHDDKKIAEAAILNYTILEKEKSVKEMQQFYQPDHIAMQTAALINSYHRGITTSGVVADEVTKLLQYHPVFTIEIITKLKDPLFHEVINSLLLDEDFTVRRKAIEYCQTVGDVRFFKNLLINYDYIELRDSVREALYKLPYQAVALIEDQLDTDLSLSAETLLLTTLGKIGKVDAFPLLSEKLNTEINPYIILISTRAMYEIAIRQKSLSIANKAFLLNHLKKFLLVVERLVKYFPANMDESGKKLYFDAIYFYFEVILYLVAGIYKVKQFIYVAEIMNKDDPVFFSNSYELIETHLPRPLAIKLIAVLDRIQYPKFNNLSPQDFQTLYHLNVWVKCILVSSLPNTRGDDMSVTQRQLLEKIKIITLLKQIALFKDIPSHYLLALFNIVQEKKLQPGEYLFKEGELGDSLYLIISGKISLSQNGKEIGLLTAGECIEELSLIDHLPRSTSALVVENSEVLQITSLDFDDVLATYPEIAHALVHKLAKRVRELG